MLKDATASLTGNDRFEGFCIDLIQELSKMLGFNYTFIVQKDGKNGNLDRETQTWDGMIGEVIKGVRHAKGDIATQTAKFQISECRFSDYRFNHHFRKRDRYRFHIAVYEFR